MSYISFAWIASFFYGVNVIAGKLTAKHAISNPWMFEFFWETCSLLYILPVALAYGVTLPAQWGPIILAGLLYALAGVLFVLSLYALDVSVLGPLYNFRAPFSVLLGVFVVGERLTATQVGLIALITLSGFLVSMDERMKLSTFFQKGVVITLIALLTSAVMNVALYQALQTNGYWEVTLFTAAVAQISLLTLIPLFVRDVKKVRLSGVGGIAFSSLFYVIGYFAANRALAHNVGITSTILSLPFSMIIAFIFSRVAPRLLEKHTLKVYAVRFIGAAIMFLAALQLSH